MECTIVKPGTACAFMNKLGCSFGAPSETCQPIVEQCEGCDHIQPWPTGRYCARYASPAAKWQMGMCNMATHAKLATKTEEKRVNPLKASKRGAAGR